MSDRIERVRQTLAMRDAEYNVRPEIEDIGHLLHQYDRLRAELAQVREILGDRERELAAKDARIEEQNAIIHGMQDGALVRDQMGLIERLRKRVAELDAHITNEYARCEAWKVRAEQAEAQLAEAKEQAHYANGVADLAMKHRDSAEAERDAMREALLLWYDEDCDCEMCVRARAALAPSEK